jgi:hypothetical protein
LGSAPKSSAEATALSKRSRVRRAASNVAQRLECGAFTAAFSRAIRLRIIENLCPLDSGAEVTALQTLARPPGGLEFRGAR